MERPIADLREQYCRGTLMEADMPENPVSLLDAWLTAAVTDKIKDPNAMTLSTVSADGQPSSRVVLLKGLDERGLSFFTNYRSRKGRELLGSEHAALNFWWKEHERQVSIRGSVSQLSREESEIYFHSRPYESQIGAWVSLQSEAIPDRAWLEKREAELMALYPKESVVPMPDHWGGFLITPLVFEFWQGRPSRLHDRFEYVRDPEGSWSRRRLSP